MKKNKIKYSKSRIYVLLALCIGLVIGYTVPTMSKDKHASPKEIEQAKNKISELLKDKTVEYCSATINKDGSVNEMSDKFVVNYRYLRVNKYANRAIITDCAGYSTLLATNKSGDWGYTTINQITDNRINPKWQKECLIEDITVADEITRPENSSIDQNNLEECLQLKK